MLDDMIDKIAELSEGTDRLDLLYETPRKYVYDNKGQLLVEPKDIPKREHTLFSLESLVAAIQNYGAASSTAWVSESQIIVVLNDDATEYRDNRLTMFMAISPFFRSLAKANWLDQKQMIDFMRHELCGTVVEPPNTLQLLRNLKFTSSVEVTGRIDNHAAALGKSAMAEVSGQDALPETVMVEFCPYPALRDILDYDVTVSCTLFTDPVASKLCLSPRPGELDAAKLSAMEAVQKKLSAMAGPDIPVFLGAPH